MSYGLSIRITLEEGGEGREERRRRELEEFLHRFRDLLSPVFVYDPLRAVEFRLERERLLREHELGPYERSLIDRMYRNLVAAEERRARELLGEDWVRGLWFFH